MPIADLSVILIACNEERFLPKSLDILKDPFFDKAQLVFVDAGSSDASYELLEKFCCGRSNTKLIKANKAINAASARNIGYQNALNELILFLDGDTEVRINFLRSAILSLRNDRIGIVVGEIPEVQYSSDMSEIGRVENRFDFLKDMGEIFFAGGNLITKRSVIEKVGGFDEKFDVNEDREFAVRVSNSYKILYLQKIMGIHHTIPYKFRIHEIMFRPSGFYTGMLFAKHIFRLKPLLKIAKADSLLFTGLIFYGLLCMSFFFTLLYLFLSFPIAILLYSCLKDFSNWRLKLHYFFLNSFFFLFGFLRGFYLPGMLLLFFNIYIGGLPNCLYAMTIDNIVNIDSCRNSRSEIHKVKRGVYGFSDNFFSTKYSQLEFFSKHKIIEELRPNLLRFPTGSLSNFYHWKTDSLNPDDLIKFKINNDYWEKLFRKYSSPGSVEFLEFVRKAASVEADIVFVLNALFNTEFDTQIKKLKQAQRLGINVKYIEIGNELYWLENRHRNFIKNYRSNIHSLIRLIRTEFPIAKIGISVGGYPSWNLAQTWDNFVFSEDLDVDAYVFHSYATYLDKVKDFPKNRALKYLNHSFPSAIKNIQRRGGGDKTIWITEWNLESKTASQTMACGHYLINFYSEILSDPNIELALFHRLWGRGGYSIIAYESVDDWGFENEISVTYNLFVTMARFFKNNFMFQKCDFGPLSRYDIVGLSFTSDDVCWIVFSNPSNKNLAIKSKHTVRMVRLYTDSNKFGLKNSTWIEQQGLLTIPARSIAMMRILSK